MKLTGGASLCRTCGLVFNSVGAFDRHRVGEYGINRRCLSVAEMEAIGMGQNRFGRWVASRMPLEARGRVQGAAITQI